MGRNDNSEKITQLRPDSQVRKLKSRQRKFKEVHRVRRNRIIAGFLVLFLLLGFQLVVTHARTKKVEQQVAINKTSLAQVKSSNKKLREKRDDLKDSDYVAKLIRYKYKYTKANEKVYNVNEQGDDKQ